MGDLLAKFYRINEDQQPLGFKLVEDDRQAIREKFWYAVMRGNFFIRIEQHQSTEGPHRCELWFKCFSPPKDAHWIASCQLMGFFFNEEEMKIATLQAISQREFFMLPSNRDKPITL